MIPKEVYNYDYGQLVQWIRYGAGSSNPDYFLAKKTGGLKLQQVPEEYAKLLLFLKEKDIKNYLELGIGNGGSFIANCFFMRDTLINGLAVDDLSYGSLIGQNDIEINSFMQNIEPMLRYETAISFLNSSTDNFFKDYTGKKFDAIFIDADHSYEGVKKDYDNALKHINKGGHIIFHDINSAACPGIQRIWSEVIKVHNHNYEFIASANCGIGVIEI